MFRRTFTSFVLIGSLGIFSGCGGSSSSGGSGGGGGDGTGPEVPTVFELFDPASSPSNDQKPTLLISGGGVKAGNTVEVYKKADCVSLLKSEEASSTSMEMTMPTLSNGTYHFSARVIDADDLPSDCTSSITYTVDTVDPDAPTVTAPTDGSTVGSSVTISGTCESGTKIYITGDVDPIPSFANCSSGTFSKGVTLAPGDGSKDLTVKAKDDAGNFSSATDLNLILDSIAPTVTIDQGSLQSDPTNNSSISFDIVFSEAIDPATFTAGDITNTGSATGVVFGAPTTLDNITWEVSTTAIGTDGTVIPTIDASKVTDDAGNSNSASSSTDNSVTYDTSPPTIVIGEPNTTLINKGFINYDVLYTGASSINLTGGNVVVSVTGTVTYTTQITSGTTSTPTITVHVTGGDGTIDSVSINPGTSSDDATNTDAGGTKGTDVTVDSTIVTVSIGSPSPHVINTGDITYAVEYAGATSENLTGTDVNVVTTGTVAYTKQVNNGTTDTPDIVLHITGGDGTIDSVSITPGTGTNGVLFDLGAADGFDVVVDNTAPTVTITEPMSTINSSNKTSYAFAGTCSEDTAVVTITSPASVAGATKVCTSGAFSFVSLDVSATPDGPVNFTVSIEDAATNSSTDSASATKDSTPPVIAVLALNGISSPGNDTTPAIDITGTFEIGDSFRLYSDMTCTTAVSSSVAAVLANTVTVTTSALLDGSYTFFAKGSDPAGNSDCESIQSVDYTLDTIVPTVTISTLSAINATNVANYTISGTCTANGDTVQITAPVTVSGSTTCAAGAYSITGVDVSVPADGPVDFTIQAIDAANNSANASSSATKDTVLPTISISGLSAIGTSNQTSYSISGTCSANGDTITITAPVIPGSTTCSGGLFTLSSLNVSGLADGTVNFTLKNQDAVGNFSTDTDSTTKDTTAPTVPSCDSLAGDATPTKSDTATWSGSTDADSGISHYEMSIGVSAAADTVGWTNIGAVVTPYQFTGLSPKLQFNTDYTTYIRAVDNAGNTSSNDTCPQWHLLNGYGNFTGTTTTAPSDPTYVNQSTSYALQYSGETFNSSYFDHSTVTDSEQITIKEPGNYFLSHTLPVIRVNGNTTTKAASATSTVKVNGTAKNIGYAANAFTRGKSGGVSEPVYSSNHLHILLENLAANDVVTIETKFNGTTFEPLKVPDDSVFSTYLEYIPDEQTIFTATATAVTNGTNLNQTTARKFKWTESIKDTGYTHSNSSTPENIMLTDAGNYLVAVNLPYTGVKANQKVEANIYVNGSNQNQTSYMDSSSGTIVNSNGHLTTSTTYTNILYNVPANAVLDVRTIRLGSSSTVLVTTGKAASIYIQKLDTSSDYYVATGTSPANWNTVAATNITWTTDHVKDVSLFSHSTSSNPQNITILEDGDYIAYISDRITAGSSVDYVHPIERLLVNGTSYPGAECNNNMTRNVFTGQLTASCNMMIFLEGLNTNDVISYTSMADIITAGTATGNPPRITLKKISN